MKNIITLLSFSLLLSTNLIAQQLFTILEHDQPIYNHLHLDTFQANKPVFFLDINWSLVNKIMSHNPENVNIHFPFFEDEEVDLKLQKFAIYSDEISTVRHTSAGTVFEQYHPRMHTYRIDSPENNLKGVFIFDTSRVKAVFSIDDQTYQIDKFKTETHETGSVYFLTNINESPIAFDFACAQDDLEQEAELIYENRLSSNNFGCIELALEIDYYTFQTFDNYQNSIDWALEMISVVSELFLSEIDLGIISNSAQIWEVEDPYYSLIDDPQNMLIAMRNNWLDNELFANIDRDLAHLFSKRNNTGTGGIAFLNGLGSTWNGYGFSSNLIDVDEYIGLPVPYFFWNIYCLAHELGHNLGAKHTQWCGWPEGPIDNCTNIEEMVTGECEDYNNSPAPEIGTIMSYCHTWSFDSGGGILMKFHDTVKAAIIAYAGTQNLVNCTNEPVFGCVDLDACNYNADATEDDNSCIYPEFGLDCFGECIYDENEDGVCDDDNVIISENGDYTVSLFPNPAIDHINLNIRGGVTKLISLKIINVVGQIVLNQSNLSNQSRIDVSSLSSGLYSAHIINEDGILKEKFIIQ
ncbi:MAG: hypothetical protein CMD23_00050 [Flavobacteriales bacterium]|nr:hypothetical protein [Flavobacteriales bacterium]|tara:strand:- start:1812 stop:3548 length:1737 start_codon:yes stop_codon:yes gene_type:complete